MIAIIVTGGIGDVLMGLQAAETLGGPKNCQIFVNSHDEILDFINTCTFYEAIKCPDRVPLLPDAENPLNLPRQFLKGLHQTFNKVYSCFPDGLGLNPFAFPWYEHYRNYKEFLRVKVPIKVSVMEPKAKRKIFCNFTCVTIEKNWPLPRIQQFVTNVNKTNYEVVIARTSKWKGTPIPFFCTGQYDDLVDRPIKEVLSVMSTSDYFVGIDSGLAHVAYHMGMPKIVLQRHFNAPFHQVRWQETTEDCLPLDADANIVFNRVILNMREPITTAIPAHISIPANINKKQLLIQKYYA